MSEHPSDARATAHAQAVLDAVRMWPGTTVEIDDSTGAASIYVGPRVIARISLTTARVRVFAPPDTLNTLLRIFPTADRETDGISFRLGGSAARGAVLSAIQRRVQVERYAWQFREESP